MLPSGRFSAFRCPYLATLAKGDGRAAPGAQPLAEQRNRWPDFKKTRSQRWLRKGPSQTPAWPYRRGKPRRPTPARLQPAIMSAFPERSWRQWRKPALPCPFPWPFPTPPPQVSRGEFHPQTGGRGPTGKMAAATKGFWLCNPHLELREAPLRKPGAACDPVGLT